MRLRAILRVRTGRRFTAGNPVSTKKRPQGRFFLFSAAVTTILPGAIIRRSTPPATPAFYRFPSASAATLPELTQLDDDFPEGAAFKRRQRVRQRLQGEGGINNRFQSDLIHGPGQILQRSTMSHTDTLNRG